jgi:hypothetical protein
MKMTAAGKLAEHVRHCLQCRPARALAEYCSAGQPMAYRAQREAEIDQQVTAQGALDQRGIDQRTGRTFAEVEEARKYAEAMAADLVTRGGDIVGAPEEYWMLRGIGIALAWTLDDDQHPMPLGDRLRNAAEGRG